MRYCPALLVAAPASGQGKTLVTAALARGYVQQGRQVRVFKCGPDFLDPMILEQASGHPVYSLDLWLVGEAECRRLLWQAAAEADLILIEGVMGLFDGQPSAADLARRFKIPVLGVIDASAMAQTFGALAYGLAQYQADLPFAGVLANRVGSQRHAEILRASLPQEVAWFGALPRQAALELPSRHLGLVQAQEVEDLEARLNAAAQAISQSLNAALPAAVGFEPPTAQEVPALLAGVRIGVAKDEAFAFTYAANLRLLQSLGAELLFFSPLHETELPAVDSLYLPGGYPELHLQPLSQNTSMHHSIRAHHAAGKPIVAECGGLLYLLEQLTDVEGQSAALVGLLPGQAQMQRRLVALALQEVELPEGNVRGHSYHHSRLESSCPPLAQGRCPNGKAVAEAVFRDGRLTASYIHFYFPSNPLATAALFRP